MFATMAGIIVRMCSGSKHLENFAFIDSAAIVGIDLFENGKELIVLEFDAVLDQGSIESMSSDLAIFILEGVVDFLGHGLSRLALFSQHSFDFVVKVNHHTVLIFENFLLQFVVNFGDGR